jgi:hypothetical protein
VLLLKKLARQNKLDTATIDDVLAEPQSPELRAVLASLRVSVESANSVPFMQLSAPPPVSKVEKCAKVHRRMGPFKLRPARDLSQFLAV